MNSPETSSVAPQMNNPGPEKSSANAATMLQPGTLNPADRHLLNYQKAVRLIRDSQFLKAIELLAMSGRSPAVLNARAFCMLRTGSYHAALQIYRSYVFQAGGTWVRSDLPVSQLLNFATALLLSGHPAGCLEILGPLSAERKHPTVLRLRQSIRTWERTLTLWQRLNWRFGRIEPDEVTIKLDFVPGELDELTQC